MDVRVWQLNGTRVLDAVAAITRRVVASWPMKLVRARTDCRLRVMMSSRVACLRGDRHGGGHGETAADMERRRRHAERIWRARDDGTGVSRAYQA